MNALVHPAGQTEGSSVWEIPALRCPEPRSQAYLPGCSGVQSQAPLSTRLKPFLCGDWRPNKLRRTGIARFDGHQAGKVFQGAAATTSSLSDC
jgi:hypothetical protein